MQTKNEFTRIFRKFYKGQCNYSGKYKGFFIEFSEKPNATILMMKDVNISKNFGKWNKERKERAKRFKKDIATRAITFSKTYCEVPLL